MAESQSIFTLFKNADEFNDYLRQTTFSRDIELIQNHHTFLPDYKGFKTHGAFPLLHSMRNYHIKTNKWSEIGQNITTFTNGSVAICRPLNMAPACIKGANKFGIGIEHVGNFNSGGDEMTPEHKESIVMVNAYLCAKFKLKPNTNSIVYHHWYDLNSGQRTNGTGVTKSCPGTNFFGGNTVKNANDNFIPLIVAHMQQSTKQVTPTSVPVSKTVTADVLNVRSGPGLFATILYKISAGKTVQVFYELNGWSKISATTDEWVNSKYIN